MGTFKAVNVWTFSAENVSPLQEQGYTVAFLQASENCQRKITIIPGHWAERIESGELLSKGEWCALKEEYKEENSYADDSTMAWDEYLIRAIARKLRGEA